MGQVDRAPTRFLRVCAFSHAAIAVARGAERANVSPQPPHPQGLLSRKRLSEREAREYGQTKERRRDCRSPRPHQAEAPREIDAIASILERLPSAGP